MSISKHRSIKKAIIQSRKEGFIYMHIYVYIKKIKLEGYKAVCFFSDMPYIVYLTW